MNSLRLRTRALATLVAALLLPATATRAQEVAPSRLAAEAEDSAPSTKRQVKVTFSNPLKKDARLYIIHPKTQLPEYQGTVKKGGELTLPSFAGHVWVTSLGDKWLQSTTGRPILLVVGDDESQRFTIPAGEVKVTFSNPLKEDVQLFLFDPALKSPMYRGTVKKGEKLTFPCYPGHQWIMGSGKTWYRTLAGELVHYEVSSEPIQRFAIRPQEVAVAFTNTLDESVNLYIVHPETGHPEFHAMVEPKGEIVLPCYPGHQWVMGAGTKWIPNSMGKPLTYSTTNKARQSFKIRWEAASRPAPPSDADSR